MDAPIRADLLEQTENPDAWKQRRLLVAALFLPATIAVDEQPPPVQALPRTLGALRDALDGDDSRGSAPFQPIGAFQEPGSLPEETDLHLHPLSRRLSFVSAVSSLQATRMPERPRSRLSRAADSSLALVERTSAGNIGLQNAIAAVPALNAANRLWIGTIGTNTDDFPPALRSALRSRLLAEHSAVPVFVSQAEFVGHYHNFCKQVLWRPFHYQLPDYPNAKAYEEASWNQYVAVNQHFADTIAQIYKDGDIIFVNDYHLMLLPLMIRKRIPSATIGFFLHIPFPSSEIFRCLHVRKQILEGLLGADLIGFQTYAFMRHFLMTCTRLLALDTMPRGVQLENSVVSLGIYPIGINLATLNEKRNNPEVAEIIATLREKYAGKRILIGRDKNDYVKGVRHKMLAFERFLKEYPEWQGRVVLIQVVLSTSEANESECHVTDVVSRINSRFGTIGYVPVVYLQQDISFTHYLALLTIADACLITSLRDGMNLTSHEYVVCQEQKHSPLIISEFAGTYGSFGAALRINPWDHQEVADAIHLALTMSEEEKNMRWQTLYRFVSTNTARTFVETFVTDTVRFHNDNLASMATSIPRLAMEDIHADYLDSHRRLILLDDVGTLYPYFNLPGVTNHNEIHRAKIILERLCANPRNMVYIMSTRSRNDLDYYFQMPGLGVCAENGCFVKFSDRSRWDTMLQDHDLSWRKRVTEILEYYADRTPGSHVEQREIGIAWHYAHAEKNFGEWQAAECYNHIETAVSATYPVHALVKKTSVEVLPRNVSKGTAVRRILEHHQIRSTVHHSHSHHRTHHRSRTLTYQASSFHSNDPSQAHALSLSLPRNHRTLFESQLEQTTQKQPLPPVQTQQSEQTKPAVQLHDSPLRADSVTDASLSRSEPESPLNLSPVEPKETNVDYKIAASTKITVSALSREGESYVSFDNSVMASMSMPSSSNMLVASASSPVSNTQTTPHHLSPRHARIDFILCIGDDRSDEHMFEFLARLEARENQRVRSMQVSGGSASTVQESQASRSRSTTANEQNVAESNRSEQMRGAPQPSLAVNASTLTSAHLHLSGTQQPQMMGTSPSSLPSNTPSGLDSSSPSFESKAIDIVNSPNSELIDTPLLHNVGVISATHSANMAMSGKALSMPNESFLMSQSFSKIRVATAATATFAPSAAGAAVPHRRRIIVTVTVGAKSSAAGWYIPNVPTVLDGLEKLSMLSENDALAVDPHPF